MSEPFKDRRKFVRIYRNFILSCRKVNSPHVQFEMCQVNNISRGGVSFSSTTPFEKGCELLIELKTPFIADKVDLKGAVIDCKEKIKGLIYVIHVEFNHISTQGAEVLIKIEQYASQES